MASLRQFRQNYQSLRAVGATRGSAALLPMWRRLPGRPRNRVAFETGERIESGRDESLLAIVNEVWKDETYLPRTSENVSSPTVVDVGANVGAFTVWAAAHLDPALTVAVEPSPRSLVWLRRNVLLNSLENVEIVEAAVAGSGGVVPLYKRGPSSLSTLFPGMFPEAPEFEADVRVVTLDEILGKFGIERCDLLKLDCEGAEYEILFGASDATLRIVRYIVGEYHLGATEYDVQSLRSFLVQRGFQFAEVPPAYEDTGHFHAWRP